MYIDIKQAHGRLYLSNGQSNPTKDKWYVVCRIHSTPYSPVKIYYLHHDGEWRTTALDNTKEGFNRYTGYFDTYEQAEKALLEKLCIPGLATPLADVGQSDQLS